MRKVVKAPNEKNILVCKYYGNKGGVTRRLLLKYIDHINLRYRTCNVPTDATGGSRNLRSECKQCNEKIDVNWLW
jgi:hypothetical protein